jgi:uncharacterized protein (TIGR02058 family)
MKTKKGYIEYGFQQKFILSEKGRRIMNRQRFIVEIGTGADLHGGDVTKAAQKAIKDAVSHSCLCGLFDIVGINNPNQMHIEVKIACPYPDKLDKNEVLKAVPFGSAQLEAVQGGLTVRGLDLPELGEGDTIVVAVAALTVYINSK